VSDHFSDRSWWPQLPPKPLKAPSVATLVFGSLVAVVAVVGALFWISGSGHSGNKAKSGARTAAVTASAAAEGNRQAFADCMRSMGAGSGFRTRGRFGRSGPSKNFREAIDVCRSLLQPGRPAPIEPPRTGTAPAPVA
jgi:hypothetical protein